MGSEVIMTQMTDGQQTNLDSICSDDTVKQSYKIHHINLSNYL